MRRRDFITLFGGAAAAWPIAARAQQTALPMIGFLSAGTPESASSVLEPFRLGLKEVGFVEGRNVAIEYRWAHNSSDQLPILAADLVRRQVNAIAALGNTPVALAAKKASASIPIIFQIGGDPVQLGLVMSLNRPGGNATGFTSLNTELTAKRMGLLQNLNPAGTRFGALINPDNPTSKSATVGLNDAASSLGREIDIVPASDNRQIDAAFARFVDRRVVGILVQNDGLFIVRRIQIISLATRHGLPAIYAGREWAEAGGLMSYGTNLADLYKQAGVYTGRILKGERAGDLPVMQAARFEFVISLQIARTLNIEIPTTLLAQADEVIE
jgi:putative ABC transport system substrate-binding protein